MKNTKNKKNVKSVKNTKNAGTGSAGIRRMLVISLDAVGGADMEYMKQLPNFGRFLKDASVCTNVESVYPSITYPAHTTIITGRMPNKHGIINNTKVQPGLASPDWYWQRKYIKGTTLYDEAIKSGMKVAALLWPVTAKSDIQYNMPEIFANRPWSNQIVTSLINGTPAYQAVLNQKFGHLRDGKRQPELDNFVQQSLLYTLQHYRPDLTLVHFTDVDTHRHLYGVHAPEIKEALERHDARLGQIMFALEKLNMDKDTDVIILGDHYQKDVSKIVYPNHFLKEKGLLEVEGQEVVAWKAICKNCDGSAYIYVKSGYGHLQETLYRMFDKLKENPESGIANVFTRQEAIAQGADPRCSLMLEAKDGYFFLDEWRTFSENVIADERQIEEEHAMKAVHGYLPEGEDYSTFFMAKGPGIAKNVSVDKMHLADEGVTMAALLGLDLGADVDGRIITEILE